MSEPQNKVYEKVTPHGTLCVYQSIAHGLILTLNEEIILSEHDSCFFHEMITHSPLFSHPQPKTVAILGMHNGILQEVLKHKTVEEIWCVSESLEMEEAVTQYFSHLLPTSQDERVKYVTLSPATWLKQQHNILDILIQSHSTESDQPSFADYHQALRANGMLILPCMPSLTHHHILKPLIQQLQKTGFDDCHTLSFPQPSYASGSRTMMMAVKNPTIKRIREKEIYNRSFATRYYNFDTHKAALALPEFVREILEVAE